MERETMLLPPWSALPLHPHPLPRKRAVGSSIVCAKCRKLRYDEYHCCQTCGIASAAFCVECFTAAEAEQRACVEEAAAAERREREESEAKRNAWKLRMTQASSHAAGLTPLLHACIVGDAAAAKTIVDKSDFLKDVDLEATAPHGPYEGKTALILAAQHGHKIIVELLLSRETHREAVDNLGMTALMHASLSGHMEVVDELLFNGATVDRIAFSGYTAMLFAACRGHHEVVRRLLAAGASPLARTPRGRNALIVAAFNGHIKTVHVLAAVQGIELDAKDNEGYTAMDAARANEHNAIVELLIAVGHPSESERMLDQRAWARAQKATA